MKELAKNILLNRRIKNSDTLSAALMHIGVGIISFVASKGVVLDSFSPFGISLIAGVPAVYTSSAAIGGFIGYFIPAIEGGAFKYIASLFAVVSVKLLLSSKRRIVESPFILAIICFLSCLVTALFAANGLGFIPLLSEALISAAAAFFVSKASKALSDTASAGLTGEETVSFITVISILLIGLSDIGSGGITLSHILGVTLILISAKFGGVTAGSVSGIAVAFSFILTKSYSEITLSFALGGMMAGMFSALGKYAQIIALNLCCFLNLAAMGMNVQSIALLIETALGSAIFLLLPKSANIYIGRFFAAAPKITSNKGFKSSLTLRLNTAANALMQVSETVEQVSSELSKINTPDYNTLTSKIENDACKGCNLRLYCWEKHRDNTLDSMLLMTKAVKSGEQNPEQFAENDFKDRCLRREKVGAAVYKHYSDYAAKISAENRLSEVRSIVTDQFEGISKMLCDLSEDFKTDEKFDTALADLAAAALKNLSLYAEEGSAIIDKFGRTSLEFKLKKTDNLAINKMQIMKLLSAVCEKDFEPPVLTETKDGTIIRLVERAVFSVDFGAYQINAENNSLCGDAYNTFNDGRGHFIIILSDGMGTGGRAAVDGAMASGLMLRLLKAGFGFDCSLKILNSSMLFKSTDESLATLDIISIDLFTGNVELYKAGAAPTVIKRNGRVGKAESSSLPAGILKDIGFDYAHIKLKSGDIILMLSDGATSEGTDWIRAELETVDDISAEGLAQKICMSARRRCTSVHSDDITVIAAILEKKF